jgi:hypothetical protein
MSEKRIRGLFERALKGGENLDYALQQIVSLLPHAVAAKTLDSITRGDVSGGLFGSLDLLPIAKPLKGALALGKEVLPHLATSGLFTKVAKSDLEKLLEFEAELEAKRFKKKLPRGSGEKLMTRDELLDLIKREGGAS